MLFDKKECENHICYFGETSVFLSKIVVWLLWKENWSLAWQFLLEVIDLDPMGYLFSWETDQSKF